jgi:hypothetical protein
MAMNEGLALVPRDDRGRERPPGPGDRGAENEIIQHIESHANHIGEVCGRAQALYMIAW